jgi:branched-chain amino acid transport system ATP-binding protein
MSAPPVNGSAPILSCRGLAVHFGGVKALTGINLDFNSGQICGLIGPNGAGKTTLLDCLSGLRFPNSGSVSLESTDVTRRSSTERARKGLRRTFQRQQTFGWLTLEDNVLIALEWRGGSGGAIADLVRAPNRVRRERDRRERALETLELCGLLADKNALAGSLPIGKARMLELARALVDRPRVLLLDEPTSGLDPQGTERLGEIIQTVRTDHSCCVVLVEHDMKFVMNVTDRLVVLNLGEILAQGPSEEVRLLPEVAAAYLG